MEVDASVSAQLGPVYLRLDQLGLLLALDDSMPPERRNLRFVDLSLGAKGPRGAAVQVDTAMVTGGGSILHDPDQGIYFGTFDLAFMYLPAEAIHYELVCGKTGALLTYAHERRVFPVSATTFSAYLQMIVLGLKGMQIEQRAEAKCRRSVRRST